jgi:hypothetical protein
MTAVGNAIKKFRPVLLICWSEDFDRPSNYDNQSEVTNQILSLGRAITGWRQVRIIRRVTFKKC